MPPDSFGPEGGGDARRERAPSLSRWCAAWHAWNAAIILAVAAERAGERIGRNRLPDMRSVAC